MARPRKCLLAQTYGPWLQPLQVYGGTTGTQTNAGPIAVTFPVRVLAHSNLTLTIPVSNPRQPDLSGKPPGARLVTNL
jgi:hypothetical protein